MLQVQGALKAFGGLTAVDRVAFDLGDVSVTGLVGPNGSGKTTLFHLITGFYRLDAGQVYFDGRPVAGMPPDRISRLGLTRTFQHSRVLAFLSVRDNLLAAAPGQSGERLLNVFFRPGRVKAEEKAFNERAEEVLDLLQLASLADQPAARLSYGQMKLLELGRALMARPRLILLDEPTAGVNPTLIRRIVDIIVQLKQEGVRFFLVEHNMPLVAELCDRLLVMDSGSLIFDGPPQTAVSDPRVIEAYLGKVDHAA
jgi:ABC-type branched-subunit amino acid transport system ATPase component